MLRCEECTELLLDFVYGLLDAGQSQQVNEHLGSCAACQDALQATLRQKALFGRAARVIDELPAFVPPAETVPATVHVSETDPLTPILPLTAAAPMPRRRRVWPWVASAAAVLLCATLFGSYQFGLGIRQNQLAELHRQVTEVDDRIARADGDFDKQLVSLKARETRKELRLQVTGPTVYNREVENRYRVAVQDLEQNAVSGNVLARLVDDKNREVYRSEEMPLRGERTVSLPAGLPVTPGAKTSLEVRASNAALAGELAQEIRIATEEPLTQITLNKRLFYVGEVVFFRSVTLDRYRLCPLEKPLRLQHSLIDAQGKVVLPLASVANAGGIASGEFALTKDLTEGDYTLQAADESGRLLAARPLRVVRDVPANLVFNRQRYKAGDKVVASFQAPRSANGTAPANTAVTVKVLDDDGKPVAQLRQPLQSFLDQQGQAEIEFQLPKLLSNNALLEVQLHDGKNREKLLRNVPVASGQPRVEFFPEGGELLAETANQVYFRATTSLGEAADLAGRVVDSKGQTVAQVQTQPHDAVAGLGVFTLTPRPGETYSLQITSPPGVTSAPALPPARTSGVGLHVENPVDAEGESIRLTLYSKTPEPLLLVADCRDRTVAEQYVSAPAGSLTTVLTPATGARGTLRVTAYAIRPDAVVPVAERLIYREPARHLALSAATDKFGYLPGEQVRMTIRSANETGVPMPGWLAALVVDERVLPNDPSAEQSMPAFFYLLSEVGQARDLDNADVLLSPGEQARRGLDLFLGTHGWRHFVPAAGADAGEKLAWFHRDNLRSVLERRGKALVAARAELRGTRQLSEDLHDRRERLTEQARLASTELSEFEQSPRQLFGIGLGVLVASLMLLGAALLFWGLLNLMRGGAARPCFLMAMALLGCCLMLMLGLGNRAAPGDDAGALAWIRLKPQRQLVVPSPADPTVKLAEIAPRSETVLRSSAPEVLRKLNAAPREETKQDRGNNPAKDVNAQNFSTSATTNSNLDKLNTPYNLYNTPYGATSELSQMTESLASRFQYAKEQQEAAVKYLLHNSATNVSPQAGIGGFGSGGGAQKPGPGSPQRGMGGFGFGGGAPNPGQGGFGGGAPGPAPVSALEAPVKSAPPAQAAGGPGSTSNEKKGPEGKAAAASTAGGSVRREYAHQHSNKVNDFQDTVFWHPALATDNGEVRVLFDLSASPTSYRVLLYGHTADGRLGGFQGRLTTRSPGQSGKR